MAVVFIIDLYFFIIGLFHTNQTYINEIERSEYNGFEDMNQHTFEMMVETLQNLETDVIDVKTLLIQIRDRMDIAAHIRHLLFYHRPDKSIMKDLLTPSTRKTFHTNEGHLVTNRYEFDNIDENNEYNSEFDDEDVSELDSKFLIDQYNLVKKFLLVNSIPVIRKFKLQRHKKHSFRSYTPLNGWMQTESRHFNKCCHFINV